MQSDAKLGPINSAVMQPLAAPETTGIQKSGFTEEADEAARYRLVIEEGPALGSFIYKTLDRVTGEVVRQLPREQLVDLIKTPQYNAGSVFDTKA